MKYDNIVKGTFLDRPNRFIANVKIADKIETVHVKNTGRCKELLVPYATVFLQESKNPERKTKYDLISVIKKTENGNILINMDSMVVNDIANDWLLQCDLFSENAKITREYTTVHNGIKSRFDFYVSDGNRRAFIEVKGVTLENNGVVSFPDAPTERGVKHINHLSALASEGYEAYILFVIQMKGVSKFTPNKKTHIEFCNALKDAAQCGVKILCYDCIVTEDSISIDKPIEYFLD